MASILVFEYKICGHGILFMHAYARTETMRKVQCPTVTSFQAAYCELRRSATVTQSDRGPRASTACDVGRCPRAGELRHLLRIYMAWSRSGCCMLFLQLSEEPLCGSSLAHPVCRIGSRGSVSITHEQTIVYGETDALRLHLHIRRVFKLGVRLLVQASVAVRRDKRPTPLHLKVTCQDRLSASVHGYPAYRTVVRYHGAC